MKFSIRKLLLLVSISLLTSSADAQCWSKVASGWFHNVGIQVDGTLWAWGKNDVGQLGDGSFANRNTPVQIGTSNDWAFVAAGDNHTIAIKNNGTLWSWGLNDSGQLGDGSFANKNIPTQIGTDFNWQLAALGTKFTTALKSNGELWTWGESGSNQLGTGSSAFNENVPVHIGVASNWVTLSAGHSAALALKSDGSLWGWGSHANGALANGLITETTQLPAQSGTDLNWTTIKTGNSTTLALKSDKSLWSWGGNTFGALGTDALPNDPAEFPMLINASPLWEYVAMGRYHSYAIKSDGTLWVWGRNQAGQIGDNTTFNRFAPVQIGIGTNWLAAMGGEQHSLAISEAHTLWAWGANTVGQLGDGTNVGKLVPTQIGLPCQLTVEQFNKRTFSVYPNPFDEALHIELNLPDQNEVVIIIYNLQGQIVSRITTTLKNGALEVPTPNLSSGLYIITINYNGKLLNLRAIKK